MEPLSDLEQALARLREAQERAALMKNRIEGWRAKGIATDLYEQILRELNASMELMQARVRRLSGHFTTYRCYLMSGEHIQGVKVWDAPDDAEVLIKVGQLLKDHPEHSSIEVWEGKRLVAHLSRS